MSDYEKIKQRKEELNKIKNNKLIENINRDKDGCFKHGCFTTSAYWMNEEQYNIIRSLYIDTEWVLLCSEIGDKENRLEIGEIDRVDLCKFFLTCCPETIGNHKCPRYKKKKKWWRLW